MAERPAPRGLIPEVGRDWTALGRPTAAPAPFTATATAGLPEPVRRWLTSAIAEGTPLARSVELRMHGEIRIGRWAPYTAVQRLSVSDGFVWAATARLLGLPIIGFDRWTRGSGQLRWRLFGAIPVVSGEGEDVTRSAAGRHAGELLMVLPTAALAPEISWRALDPDRAVAVVGAGPAAHEVVLTVGPDGALREVVMSRWGELGKGSYGEQVFGATLHGKTTVGGLTVPRRVTAGWHYGTPRWAEGQFIRFTVDDLRPV